MRAVVQRVKSASVRVDGEVVGQCGAGLLVLAAAHVRDLDQDAIKLADRIAGLRIFNDEAGKMNLGLESIEQPEARILAVSQFTLYGDAMKSRRPSFTESAPYEEGRRLFDLFVARLRESIPDVETGVFGASMEVSLVNDGPVTLILDAGPSG